MFRVLRYISILKVSSIPFCFHLIGICLPFDKIPHESLLPCRCRSSSFLSLRWCPGHWKSMMFVLRLLLSSSYNIHFLFGITWVIVTVNFIISYVRLLSILFLPNASISSDVIYVPSASAVCRVSHLLSKHDSYNFAVNILLISQNVSCHCIHSFFILLFSVDYFLLSIGSLSYFSIVASKCLKLSHSF